MRASSQKAHQFHSNLAQRSREGFALPVLYQTDRRSHDVTFARGVVNRFEAAELLAALAAIAWGRGEKANAQKAWAHVGLSNRAKHLHNKYLVAQLRWPPAVSLACTRTFVTPCKQASDKSLACSFIRSDCTFDVHYLLVLPQMVESMLEFGRNAAQ